MKLTDLKKVLGVLEDSRYVTKADYASWGVWSECTLCGAEPDSRRTSPCCKYGGAIKIVEAAIAEAEADRLEAAVDLNYEIMVEDDE